MNQSQAKILVTGANGQLGRAFQQIATDSTAQYVFADKNSLNINNQADVIAFLQQNQISHLVNTAAYNAVDQAQAETELAIATNATAPEFLAKQCLERDIKFIHISSDYVFSGKQNHAYIETNTPEPINTYGKSKLLGEHAVLKANPQALILRTSWLFSQWGNNFLLSMLKSSQQDLNIVTDQIGGPTWALHLALLIDKVILLSKAEEINGIYHFCGYPFVSRYQFAQEIFDQALELGVIANKLKLNAIDSSQWQSPEPRPANSCLDISKITDYFYAANAKLEKDHRLFNKLDLPFKRDWRDGIAVALAALK